MNCEFPAAEMPEAGKIHLWWVDLDAQAGGAAACEPEAFLSTEEHERADRFRFARDASRFRLCRAMLRLALGWYLGRDPREIELSTGPFGKPYLASEAGLFFNLAHCDGLGVIAFSTLGEVGVDVEAAHRTIEAMEIASAFFTAREAKSIAEAGEARNAAFLRIWTRKEAVLKAVGCGLQQSLDSLDVTQDLVSMNASATGVTQWRVLDLTPKEGFAAAIAAAPGAWSVTPWHVSWEDAVARVAARILGKPPGALQVAG